MFLYKRIYQWFARKGAALNGLPGAGISEREARDLNVEVTRIRLPSGKEVVIVKRHSQPDE